MCGADDDDLSDDLSGLPLDSSTGVDAVRTGDGRREEGDGRGELGAEADVEKGIGSSASSAS